MRTHTKPEGSKNAELATPYLLHFFTKRQDHVVEQHDLNLKISNFIISRENTDIPQAASEHAFAAHLEVQAVQCLINGTKQISWDSQMPCYRLELILCDTASGVVHSCSYAKPMM